MAVQHIAAAEGKQLDRIGDIVALSRAEAGLLAGNPIPFAVIDDERYRRFLYYKIFKNTSICTYPDVMKSVRMFWGKGLYYSEDPAQPATMIFNTPILTPEDDPSALFKAPLIRAAGVTLLLTATTETPEVTADVSVSAVSSGSVAVSSLPALIEETEFTAAVYVTGGFCSVMATMLPEMERGRQFA